MPAELKYTTGDATKPNGKGPRVIVHCCNDIGAWGAGFVIALSKTFGRAPGSPEFEYRKWHRDWLDAEAEKRTHEVKPPFKRGEVQFVQVQKGEDSIWVANLIGQQGTGPLPGGKPPIDYDAIARGLDSIGQFCKNNDATIHCPKFGAGLAGGDWLEIEKRLMLHAINEDVAVTVYEFDPK